MSTMLTYTITQLDYS